MRVLVFVLLLSWVAGADDFYAAWKRRYLHVRGDQAWVRIRPPSDDTVSEAHGYGMLLTVAHGDRREFDALLRFRHAHPSPTSRWLMEWELPVRASRSSAVDGDLDAAYALLWAQRRWGGKYAAEARLVLGEVWRVSNPALGVPSMGDFVDRNEPEFWWGVRTSDLMPGHYRAFARATGDARWTRAVDRAYSLLEGLRSPVGLWPDFALVSPRLRAVGANYLEGAGDGAFSYNACRVPWRVGVDRDPRARALLARLVAWAPSRFLDGYRLDGKVLGADEVCSQAFLAPLAVAAGTPARWAAVTSVPLAAEDYYGNTIKALCLLVREGRWVQL